MVGGGWWVVGVGGGWWVVGGGWWVVGGGWWPESDLDGRVVWWVVGGERTGPGETYVKTHRGTEILIDRKCSSFK